MFGLSKKEKEERAFRKEAKEHLAQEKRSQKALEIEQKNEVATVRCPDCYTWFEESKIFCTGCGRAIGKEGFNELPSGESFWFCTVCNLKFSSREEYTTHHYKHG